MGALRRFVKARLRRFLLQVLEDDPIPRLRQKGAKIGNSVFIGPDVFIDERFAHFLTIEDNVVISARSMIILHDSAFNNVCGAPIKVARVTISEGAYVGVNSVVLCGVTIGAGAIVGAGSVVTKNVPSHCVAIGCPAKTHGKVSDFLSFLDARRAWNVPPWRIRTQVLTREEEELSYQAFVASLEAERHEE